MYSRKSVGPRMEPWGTPALTGYCCEDFHSKPLEAVHHWEKKKWGQISDLKFHKTWVCEKDQHGGLQKIMQLKVILWCCLKGLKPSDSQPFETICAIKLLLFEEAKPFVFLLFRLLPNKRLLLFASAELFGLPCLS